MLVVTIEVKTEYSDILYGCVAAVSCVRKCCHPRTFVCASCAFPRRMCPNNFEAVTSMFAPLFVRACVDSSKNLRIQTPCRRSRLGSDCTMMLAQNRTYALRCNMIISSAETEAVVHFSCTFLHIGACACLLAECD